MAQNCEHAECTSVRIYQCEGQILICVAGDLPHPGYDVNIEQSPLRIFPPQYNVMRCPKPGAFPQVITPYKVSRSFPMAEQVPEITVHHAGGTQKVAVEPCPDELADYVHSCQPAPAYGGIDEATGVTGVTATGRSTNLSFDEAFADAVGQLPASPVIDGMTRVTVAEIGGLFGGIAGFHELFVKVNASIDGL